MDTNKLHADPTVRAALLAYHDRPGDKEGNAVVQAVLAKLPGMPAHEWIDKMGHYIDMLQVAQNPATRNYAAASLRNFTRSRIQPAASEAEGVTMDGMLETFGKLCDYLGIDTEAARKAPGKPSDVFIAAIEAKVAAGEAAPTIRNPLMVASEAGAVPVGYFINDSAQGMKPHYSQIDEQFKGNDDVFPLYRFASSAQHPDDIAVDKFAAAMKQKLAHAREKGRDGWQHESGAYLSESLREHVDKGDPRDVANFCMFLWNLGMPICPSPSAPAAERPSDDDLWDKTLKERDDYHDMADDLAAQIAAITGVEIGEHSSANDPWHNAMLAADEFIADQLRKLCTAPAAESAESVADHDAVDLARAGMELHPTGSPEYIVCAELVRVAEAAAPVPAEPVCPECHGSGWIATNQVEVMDCPNGCSMPTAATADAQGDERAAFKAWYVNRYDREPDMGQGGAIGRWEAWQAARALSRQPTQQVAQGDERAEAHAGIDSLDGQLEYLIGRVKTIPSADMVSLTVINIRERLEKIRAALSRQPSAAASALDQYSYQQLFDAIAAAISASELVAIRVSVEAFRAALAAAKPEGGSHE